jgi:hypothetical protein
MDTLEALRFAQDPKNDGVKLKCSADNEEYTIALNWIIGKGKPVNGYWFNARSAEWSVVPQGVKFTKAIEALKRGKRIRCRFDDIEFTFSLPQHCITVEQILHGEWYIV